ncbi:unnamed protein product [Urochloa humidicola]
MSGCGGGTVGPGSPELPEAGGGCSGVDEEGAGSRFAGKDEASPVAAPPLPRPRRAAAHPLPFPVSSEPPPLPSFPHPGRAASLQGEKLELGRARRNSSEELEHNHGKGEHRWEELGRVLLSMAGGRRNLM